MSAHNNPLPPVRVFVSYVRSDDQTFDITRSFKEHLQQLIKALSGRPAEVFLDRDDIPLGEDWREKIHSAVKYSYFFVPIYTGSYPQSAPCREEFLLFRAAAEQRSVKQLIIPVIWFGLESLLPEGEDEISDYVRNHQAALFDEAWVQGPSSPPYRENIAKIAKRILAVAPEIDAALAASEELEAGLDKQETKPGVSLEQFSGSIVDLQEESLGSGDENESEDDGLLELADAFQKEFRQVTSSASALTEAIRELGDLPSPPESSQMTSKDASRYMLRVASIMKKPAETIDTQGQTMLDAMESSDDLLRRMVRLTRTTESEELIANTYKSLSENLASLNGLEEVVDQLERLLTSMKTPEALSASVRRAVKPARRGIVAVQDSIRLMGQWPELVRTLGAAARV